MSFYPDPNWVELCVVSNRTLGSDWTSFKILQVTSKSKGEQETEILQKSSSFSVCLTKGEPAQGVTLMCLKIDRLGKNVDPITEQPTFCLCLNEITQHEVECLSNHHLNKKNIYIRKKGTWYTVGVVPRI